MILYCHDLALEEFNRIAILDIDDPMPNDDMLTLQVELCRWQRRCFGGATDWQMVLGMIEEVGEFDEAESPEDRYDAVGDVVVFGSQLLTLHRLGLNIAITDAEQLAVLVQAGQEKQLSLTQVMGRLARVTLKGNQKIRGLTDKNAYRVATYKAVVDMFATVMGHRYTALGPIVTSVARQVVLKRTKGHKAIPA